MNRVLGPSNSGSGLQLEFFHPFPDPPHQPVSRHRLSSEGRATRKEVRRQVPRSLGDGVTTKGLDQ